MIIVVGGGSGLPTSGAVLHITAPVGSSIELKKGSTVVTTLASGKGHTLNDDATIADWYYPVSSSNYGSWTITASKTTSGVTDTSAKTINVSAAKQYDVFLTYNLYVIRTGAIISPFTRAIKSGYTEAYKSGNYYYFHQIDGTYWGGAVVSFGQIPSSYRQFNSLVCEFNKISVSDSSTKTYMGIVSEPASAQAIPGAEAQTYKTGSQASATTLTLNVSSTTLTNKYVHFWFSDGTDTFANCYISNLYFKH